MIDIKTIREDADLVKKSVQEKNERGDVDAVLALDASRKEILASVEGLKAEKNRASKDIGLLKKQGKTPEEAVQKMKAVGEKIRGLDGQLSNTEARLRAKILEIPNIPDESVPKGKNAAENVLVREWGDPKGEGFEPLDHLEIGEKLDILDFKRGAKVAGSGFSFLKGWGARLERALINFFLDSNGKNGYQEIVPPFLVNEKSAEGTGQLPKARDQMYYIAEDKLFLIPTAEVPVTNIFQNEILSYKDLPRYLTAYSPCFRREAGSWGKDTRGFLRVHEFNKVEMVKFVEPDQSESELESLVKEAESLLQALALPYRVMELCRGDLSFAAAKCYDLEVYARGEKRWLEVSSCSNFKDFQSRRANIRFRNEAGKVNFLHTLNGSGLPTARVLVAILENYQNPDCTITVPDVLRPYMGGVLTIGEKG